MAIQPGPPITTTINNDQTVRAASVAAYVKHAGFTGDDLVTALAVAKAESGWDYKIVGGPNKNGTKDYGLFQINDIHKPSEAVKTQPIPNAQFAYKLYKAKGGKFTDWSAYNSGAYKQYLPAGKAAVAELAKRGADFERTAIASGGASDPISPGALETLGPSSPFDMAKDLFNKFLSFLNVSLGFLLAIVFIIVGFVLLNRQAIGRVVTGTKQEMAKRAKGTVK